MFFKLYQFSTRANSEAETELNTLADFRYKRGIDVSRGATFSVKSGKRHIRIRSTILERGDGKACKSVRAEDPILK